MVEDHEGGVFFESLRRSLLAVEEEGGSAELELCRTSWNTSVRELRLIFKLLLLVLSNRETTSP